MIEVKNISKSYMTDGAENRVFSDFSCKIPTDDFTVVTGASGSGKTTLVRMIANLEQPDHGSITGVPDSISVIFQEPRLFTHLSVLENVALVCTHERAKNVLYALGLESALEKKPSELSGGMAQRVAIARAVAYGADFCIMDEPFKGLDEELKVSVMEYVRSNVPAGIIITHQSDEAQFFAGKTLRI